MNNIDGNQFLQQLEQILDRHQASDVQEYERRLRDEFAAKAMNAFIIEGGAKKLLSTTNERDYKFITDFMSEESYKIADAMMKAREK